MEAGNSHTKPRAIQDYRIKKKKKEREGKVISRSIGGIIHRQQALPKPGHLPGRKSTSNGKNQSFGGAFSCQ